MTQQNSQTHNHAPPPPPPAPPPMTTAWAFDNVAGSYADIGQAREKLREAATKGCRIIGGMSNMPIPIGHELCVTVVPIEESALFPINAHAKAFVKGQKALADLKPDEKAEMPRWGLGKSIIMSLATAVGVEWTGRKRLDNGTDPYFCEVQVWGRYRHGDGTYRPIGQTCDMDYRDNSPQIAGKSDAQIAQLRATIKRKAETGAKLRALREAFGIDHGINDDQIDRPFVISRVTFTGRTDDPAFKTIFALTIAQQHLAASGALFGQIAPSIPLVGPAPSAAAPQLGMGSRAASTTGDLDDADDPDLAEGTRAEAGAVSAEAPAARPAPLPPPPPKPAPAPGDPARVYLPGKDGGPIAKAQPKDLIFWEKTRRKEFDEGMDARYAHKNTIQLLTMRAWMREKSIAVEPHEGLDAMDPKSRSASPAPKPESRGPTGNGDRPADPPLPRRPSYGQQRSDGARPPSDKGPPADTRSEDDRLADAAFGPDDEDHGPDDR